jgi:glycosyltransferase involved in cell wall biosynthesis
VSFPTKLTIACTFGIHPPRGGGQLRILHLYRQLARRCPVEVVSLVAREAHPRELELAPGMTEIRIPKSIAHREAEWELESKAGVPVTDVAFARLHQLTPAFTEAIARSATSEGNVLVASHPYTLPALLAARDRAPVWYEAQDVEADLKASIFARNKAGRKLLAEVRQLERACCERAELVFACSAADAGRLRALYGVADAKLAVVPNGVDVAAIQFRSPSARGQLRARLGMESPVALFVGSWHEPNVRAVRRIVELAPQLPDVQFAIVGSVCAAFEDVALPANVTLFGVVADGLKESVLGVAAVAVNPMLEGSGTNLKMPEYLAAGVPVVSTEIGARGLGLDPERHARIVSLERFPAAITAALQEPAEQADARASAGRRHIEEHFDWAIVAQRLMLAADELAADRDDSPADPPGAVVGDGVTAAQTRG